MHEISVTNGTASFADSRVDTQGRVDAWHKLGTPVGHTMTAEEALNAAFLANWNVRKVPLWADIRTDADYNGQGGAGLLVPGQYATVFNNPVTKKITPIGVVGKRYTPIQNEGLTEFADALVDEGGAHYETAGSLRDYSQVFLTMKLPRQLRLTGSDGTTDDTDYYLALFNSHDGNSAMFGVLTTTRVVCHAVGTPVLHKGQWGPVEEHPGVMGLKHDVGRAVKIAGLPFSETVTWDHRYWGRKAGSDEALGWVFAGDMALRGHEIATPIDRTIENVREYWDDERATDPRWWWALGYLWGDGNVSHPQKPGRQGKVVFTIAEPEAKSAVFTLLRERGYQGNGTDRGSHMQVTVADQSLYEVLDSFYRSWPDGGKPGGKGAREKVPPTWVERIDPELQAAFVRGYFDADGSLDKAKGGEIVSSTSLDGLLLLRRILARLGKTSLIRKGTERVGAQLIMGRTVNQRAAWTLRIPGSPNTSLVRIEGDWLLSRVDGIEDGVEAMFVPLDVAEDNHQYVTHFGLSHNCANTARAAIAGAQSKFSVRHTSGYRNAVQEARESLGLVWEYEEAFETEVKNLFAQPFDSDEMKAFSEDLVKLADVEDGSVAATKRRNEAGALHKLFVSSPTIVGTPIAGTRWGAYNSVTEYVDHFSTVRGGGDDVDVAATARATRVLAASTVGGSSGETVGLKADAWRILTTN